MTAKLFPATEANLVVFLQLVSRHLSFPGLPIMVCLFPRAIFFSFFL